MKNRFSVNRQKECLKNKAKALFIIWVTDHQKRSIEKRHIANYELLDLQLELPNYNNIS